MPAPSTRRHGLRLQLTLFYIALSVPALLVIEQSILGFEFQRCLTQLDDGRVDRVLAREAASLSAALARGIDQPEVDQRLRRFVLELERPRESLGLPGRQQRQALPPRRHLHLVLRHLAVIPPTNLKRQRGKQRRTLRNR